MPRSLPEWEDILRERRVRLPNQSLASGIQFLLDARAGDGWGVLPGAEFDRYASALAMEALWSGEDRAQYGYQLENTALAMKRRYERQLRGLGTDALADVAVLFLPIAADIDEIRTGIARRAAELIDAAVRQPPPGGARQIARLVLALQAGHYPTEDETLSRARTFLLDQQNQHLGGWSVSRDAQSAVAPTADVLRALGALGEEAEEARRQGRVWFVHAVKAIAEDVNSSETFDLATSLRALASLDNADYELVLALEDELVRRQGVGGGWPTQPDRDAAVEPSALAVLALTEAGARDHVPFRLAETILAVAREQVAGISDERNRLQSDVSSQVQAQIDEVMADRKRLIGERESWRHTGEENARLREEVRYLRRIADPVAYEDALFDKQLSYRARTATLGVIAAIAIVAGAVAVWLPSRIGLAAIGATVALLGSGLALYWQRDLSVRRYGALRRATQRAREQWDEVAIGEIDAPIGSLRSALIDITSEWRPSAREELAYVLYEEFLDAPSDIARRRSEQVALRLGAPPSSIAEFARWAGAVGLLDESERRVLFDQVRRLLL
jgi:hypothetical protein